MKRISILGSTGAIGVNTLAIVDADPSSWKVEALSCGRNWKLLAAQIEKYKPSFVSVADDETADKLADYLKSRRVGKLTIGTGADGLDDAASLDNVDTVLLGVSGAAGLSPAWSAVEAGKRLAIANKEAIVLAGDLLLEMAAKTGSEVIPVDSEHSALWQLMKGVRPGEVARVWLGASGGPFRKAPKSKLEKVTVKEALNHPVWKMGKRITIDSATMMNKGLEIIEACRLFGVTEDRVGVFVHPEGLVHAMVETVDGVMLAHVSRPDMKGPIAYALYYPNRPAGALPAPNLFNGVKWTFEEAEPDKFPCLDLARKAIRLGGTMPAALNAADEVAVEAFLAGKIGFMDIPKTIEKVLKRHHNKKVKNPTDALKADRLARAEASKIVEGKLRKAAVSRPGKA